MQIPKATLSLRRYFTSQDSYYNKSANTKVHKQIKT